jgi:D-alanyl-D-alanine carboxypeptidase
MKTIFIPFSFVLIFGIMLISCSKDSNKPQSRLLTENTIGRLNKAADSIMMKYQTPGMIAYIGVKGEDGLYITRGVGNLTTNEPMNVSNYFRIASVTKTFTAEAVLILAGEGKIDLNKTISFYLPELQIPGKESITIRMLGNMTSGLVDYLGDSTLQVAYYNSDGIIQFTSEELMVPILKSKLLFTPGSKFDYCNTNFILLGLVIKKVTGKSVKDVLYEKIFQPLGLTHTFWTENIYLPSPYHHSYTTVLGTVKDVTYWGNSWGNSAGILISNIEDLKIWAKEFNESKLLSESMKAERIRWIRQSTSDDIVYGFGLERLADWIGHSGLITGWNTQVYYQTKKDITIVVATNSDENQPAFWAFASFAKILDPSFAKLLNK